MAWNNATTPQKDKPKNVVVKLPKKRDVINEIYLNYPWRGSYVNLLDDYKTRTTIYMGGAGSGKSYFVFQKIIIKCLKIPNRRVFVFRKVLNTVRNSVFSGLVGILKEWGLLGIVTINKTVYEITFDNGSTIICMGMDDEEKVKSIQATDIVCEEVTELSKDEFEQLELRLREKRLGYNQIHVMYNPISNNWVKDYWHNEKFFPDNTILCKTTFLDNRFLPADYIAKMQELKITNPTKYAIYVKGEFAQEGDAIYTNWKIEPVDDIKLRKDGVRAYFSCDPGFNDPTAFLGAFVDPVNRKIYIFDEHYEQGMITKEIGDMIVSKGYAKEEIIMDNQEKRIIAELRRSHLPRIKPSIKGKDSINHGISFIQSFEIIVDPSCKNMIMELENYVWKKDKQTKKPTNTPIDKHNHLCDCLRYLVKSLMPRQRIKTFNKAHLGL